MFKHTVYFLLLLATQSFQAVETSIARKELSTNSIDALNSDKNIRHAMGNRTEIGPEKLQRGNKIPVNVDGKSVTCGGSLQSSSGHIEYKQFETVEKNERCVWIIQPLDGTYASVQLYQNNPAPPSGSLLVTGFAIYGSANPLLFESVTPTTSRTEIRNASMLVVTFTTTETTTGNGFSLMYSFGKVTGALSPSQKSRNVLATSDIGYIRHPALQTEIYPPFDLSVFVVLPKEVCTRPDKIRLRYSEIQLESGNYDSLFLYEFTRPSWKFRGRIVSGAESQLITSQDILMVVFVSDSSNEYKGFELFYAVC